jgi:hypothetical protein
MSNEIITKSVGKCLEDGGRGLFRHSVGWRRQAKPTKNLAQDNLIEIQTGYLSNGILERYHYTALQAFRVLAWPGLTQDIGVEPRQHEKAM